MPGITKARFNEIQTTARTILDQQGGVMVVDKLPEDVRNSVLVAMNHLLKAAEGITYDTASRHVAKAMRRERGEIIKDRRGGARKGAGAPEGNTNAAK